MATSDGDGIEWDEPVTSSRDRSLVARLGRSIERGDDELEPANESLARVRSWLAADDSNRPDVREISADLAILDTLTYEEVRREVAKAAGVRAPILDAERAALRKRTEKRRDGPMLVDVEPWPEEVDGVELLDGLAQTFARFVALPDGAATAMSLWVVFAHAHEASYFSPLLALTSPEKRCGKTTALSVLSQLVPRQMPASNISPAALYRAVDHFRPTLLVDEADSFLRDRDDLRGILNAGHLRTTAYVARCEGDDHEPRLFTTWAPKAIALIGQLPDTLEDRAISVSMRRRAPGEAIERLRLDRAGEFEPLRRKAARWAVDHLEELRAADPETPGGLNDRAADNWRTLLAIADLVGGDWPGRARRAARLLTATGSDDDGSVRTLLLRDIRDLFDRLDVDRIPSEGVVLALGQMEERPWQEWGRTNKPITARAVARLLKPFGVKPRQMKVGGDKVRGYKRDWFEDAWTRYVPGSDAPTGLATLPPGTPVPPASTAGQSGTASGTGSDAVPDATKRKAAPQLNRTGVPPGESGTGAREGINTAAGDEWRMPWDGEGL